MRFLSGARATAIALAGAVALAVVPAAPASAAPGGLEFSRDGVSWQSATPASVFDTTPVLVPGVSQTATWFVRNGHTQKARFSAVISDVTWSSAVAAELFELAASDGIGGGFAATPVGQIVDCAAATTDRILQPGEIARVNVSVGIPATVDGTTGFSESMSFALALALAEPSAPVGADGCPVDPIIIPSLPGRPAGSGAGTAGGFREPGVGSLPDQVTDPGRQEPPPGGTPAQATPLSPEWIMCTVKAFASALGSPAASCTDFSSNEGVAFLLGLIFIMLATVWFLLLWRRRQRDDEDEAPHGGAA